jgi:hypothetical protein
VSALSPPAAWLLRPGTRGSLAAATLRCPRSRELRGSGRHSHRVMPLHPSPLECRRCDSRRYEIRVRGRIGKSRSRFDGFDAEVEPAETILSGERSATRRRCTGARADPGTRSRARRGETGRRPPPRPGVHRGLASRGAHPLECGVAEGCTPDGSLVDNPFRVRPSVQNDADRRPARSAPQGRRARVPERADSAPPAEDRPPDRGPASRQALLDEGVEAG